jgi:hypothetical protein
MNTRSEQVDSKSASLCAAAVGSEISKGVVGKSRTRTARSAGGVFEQEERVSLQYLA